MCMVGSECHRTLLLFSEKLEHGGRHWQEQAASGNTKAAKVPGMISIGRRGGLESRYSLHLLRLSLLYAILLGLEVPPQTEWRLHRDNDVFTEIMMFLSSFIAEIHGIFGCRIPVWYHELNPFSFHSFPSSVSPQLFETDLQLFFLLAGLKRRLIDEWVSWLVF